MVVGLIFIRIIHKMMDMWCQEGLLSISTLKNNTGLALRSVCFQLAPFSIPAKMRSGSPTTIESQLPLGGTPNLVCTKRGLGPLGSMK